MGLFDFFSRKSGLEKHAERVANKRTQNPDRWESIQFLGKLATTGPAEDRPRAIAALLERFPFYVDPSITDGEEKDETFRWICETGELAVEPVRAALRRHESVSWPLKVLEQILPPDQVVLEMLAVLATMDTEYARDPQRKVQLLAALEAKSHPNIASGVAPFLRDVHEDARFHAYGATLAQDNLRDHVGALVSALAEEESVRVRVRVLDHFIEHRLPLGEGVAGLAFPDGYTRGPDGVPSKGPRGSSPKPAAKR